MTCNVINSEKANIERLHGSGKKLVEEGMDQRFGCRRYLMCCRDRVSS